MARVPYVPVPEVQPTSQGTPGVRVDAPVAAFGGATAEALGGVGRALDQTGNEVFARAVALQELNNHTTAQNMTIDAAQKLGDARAEYLNNLGTNAAAAYPIYKKKLADIHQATLDAAPNPAVRVMVGSELTSRISRDLDYAGSFAAEQTRLAAVGALKGTTALALNDARNSQSEDELNTNIDKQVQSIRQEGAIKGSPEAEIQASIAEQTSLAKQQYTEKLALSDPFSAQRYYTAHSGEFGKYDLITKEFLQRQLLTKGAEQISNGVLNSTGYDQRLAAKESNNQINAKSPTSSASGLYQFTDDTWASVRRAHPDLNLPATVAGASAEQQKTAVDAFTADNSKVLTSAGIMASQPNLYMAHFLGADGASRYIKGMQADPTVPATSLVSPAVVAANRSVFLHPDGSPKSAGEAYMQLTSTFMGPGPLDRNSDSRWLSRAQAAGIAIAEQFNDFAPGIKEAVTSKINVAYSNIHRMAQQADQQTYFTIAQAIGGVGQPNAMTDVSQIMANPILAENYTHLPEAYQKRIQSQLKANATFSPNPTPERDKNFQSIMNASVEISGKRPEFMQIDPYALVNDGAITRAQADKIYTTQRQIMNGQAADSRRLSHALNLSKDYLKANSIIAGSDDELQFNGAMNRWLTDYESDKKHFPTDEEIRTKAADLVSTVDRGFMGFGGRYSFTPPSSFVKEITPQFSKRFNRDPTTEDLARMYQYSTTHPNWREEIGIGR